MAHGAALPDCSRPIAPPRERCAHWAHSHGAVQTQGLSHDAAARRALPRAQRCSHLRQTQSSCLRLNPPSNKQRASALCPGIVALLWGGRGRGMATPTRAGEGDSALPAMPAHASATRTSKAAMAASADASGLDDIDFVRLVKDRVFGFKIPPRRGGASGYV